jgi:hypothetical protein
MSKDRFMRGALWATVALNLLGVFVFAPPAVGYPSALMPLAAPPYYAAQVAFTIALFGGVYAWLACQRHINRPLVIVGALGKLGFFLLAVAYWLAGDLSADVVPKAAPDLVLAGIFLWWALTTSDARPAVTSSVA